MGKFLFSLYGFGEEEDLGIGWVYIFGLGLGEGGEEVGDEDDNLPVGHFALGSEVHVLVGFGGVDAVEGVFFGGVEGGEGDGEGEILKEHLHILSKCLYSNIDSLFTYLQHIMNLYLLDRKSVV